MSRPLLLLFLLAFLLRVYALGSQSLWYDEAVTAQVTQQGLAEMARWTADDIQPPLYYAIVAGWVQAAGLSEWALRFPSAFFGMLMVPLAYALGRRLFWPAAGLLAALLATLHPLWIYYSQEARMYTLLTALGMAAGYALLRVLAAGRRDGGRRARGTEKEKFNFSEEVELLGQGARPRARWWAALVVASIALLYTHYFAVFLLAALALYFLLSLARQDLNRRSLLIEGAAAALLVVAAYLPWLPNALRRFGEDASYWQGALKLNEALRHIAISFSVGETVLEQQAIPLAGIVAALAVLALAALLWAALAQKKAHAPGASPAASAKLPWSILFLLLYLLLPIAAILLLSTGNPKFNPRYLMLASPGLVLLLAGGLALPFRRPSQLPIPNSPSTIDHSPIHRSPFRLPHALSLLSLAALLAIFLYADYNWFTDPAFTKDDWRGVVSYVKSQLQPDETVILVSGHAYPAWRYYAPDIEPLRLPEIETLDVNAVLDLSAAATLNQELAGQRGAWLVQWQEEVVDPTGVLPYLLAAAGETQPAAASFWGLGAPLHTRFPDALRTEPDGPGTAFPEALPLTAADQGQRLDVNFANQVELLGFSQPPCEQPLCPIYLFWRSLAPLDADLKLTATLFERDLPEAASQPLDRRLAAYEYPTFRWQPGAVVLSQLDIPATLGIPPGEYRLRLGVYDAADGQPLETLDAAGAPQGQSVWLEPVTVRQLVTDGPGGPPAESQPAALAPEITLQGLTTDHSQVEPGDGIRVEAWWQAHAQPGQDYQVGYQWIDPTGQVQEGGWLAPARAAFPTTQWPMGAPVRGQLSFRAPEDAQPGLWTLRLGLQAAGQDDPTASFAGATVDLPVTVLPSTRRFESSAPFDFPSGANFAMLVELLGARVAAPLQGGAVTPVTVGWRSMQATERSYTGFVHLLDQEGRIVAQDDHLPLHGQRPTTAWVEGEVIEDGYELRLPADLPPGDYWLEIGLYDADRPGLPRLDAPARLGPLTVSAD